MNHKERRKRFQIGIDYLEKTGLDLIVQSGFGRLVFKPGSLFENKEKETLSIPITAKERYGIVTYTLSEDLRQRFQITTEVDLQRLVRACAILITDFNGPEKDDTPDVLFKRLRTFMKEKSNRTGWEIHMALLTIDDILGYRKKRKDREYYDLAWILNIHHNLWKERAPFETFSI